MRAVTTGMQVHLLLFMVALFHIITAALVLVIANLRMRSWWRWKQSDDQEARLCAVTLGRGPFAAAPPRCPDRH